HVGTARAEELGERSSTLAARAEAPWSEGWAPTVVLIPPGAASPEAAGRLVAAAQPHRSGIALVAASTAATRWRLHIDTLGTTVLEPLGMILRCGLDPAALAAAESLLAAATQPSAPAEPQAVDEPQPAPAAVIDLADAEPPAPEVEVQVLGPIEVAG